MLRIAAGAAACVLVVPALADPPGDPAASLGGRQVLRQDGDPTYKIDNDGTVDWYTYSGFVRYSAECLRCHGPDGLGSSYGPILTQSLQKSATPTSTPLLPAANRT